jgi:hypothetical protein
MTTHSYALLIGISDYSIYDASADMPRGTSNLPGSVNDARAFYRHCRGLGIRPENIWVLTSPKLSPSDLEMDEQGAGGVHTGEATREEILDKVAWIAAKLGDESQPTGLMTYSGHGDYLAGDGFVLCPSDVARDGRQGLKNAVSCKELQGIVREHGASANLTVLLDACHAGAARATVKDEKEKGAPESRTSLTNRAIKVGMLATDAPAISDRVVTACARDQSAHQSTFSGEDRGAFSWAVGSVLNQWKKVEEGDHVRLTLSYGELVSRADRLLKSLSFHEAPELFGAPQLGELAFLQKGLAVIPGATSREPDATWTAAQLEPPGAADYTLVQMTANSTVFASVVIASTGATITGITFTAGDEHWSMNANGPGTANVSLSITANQSWPVGTGVPNFPVGSARPTFNMPASITWSSAPANPSGVHLVTLVTGVKQGLKFNLSYDSGLSRWGGSLIWYQSVPSGNSPTSYVLGGGGTLTYNAGSVSPPVNHGWYNSTVNV